LIVDMTPAVTRSAPPEHMTRYVGLADWWGSHVWLERDGARSSLPYRGEDSVMGFAWGRRGLFARELSRSILHDATGSPALADRLCREFTHEVVARLPQLGFELDRDDVLSWLDSRHPGN
jgi:hypothetical protein